MGLSVASAAVDDGIRVEQLIDDEDDGGFPFAVYTRELDAVVVERELTNLVDSAVATVRKRRDTSNKRLKLGILELLHGKTVNKKQLIAIYKRAGYKNPAASIRSHLRGCGLDGNPLLAQCASSDLFTLVVYDM
jgi:hypothetical protein